MNLKNRVTVLKATFIVILGIGYCIIAYGVLSVVIPRALGVSYLPVISPIDLTIALSAAVSFGLLSAKATIIVALLGIGLLERLDE